MCVGVYHADFFFEPLGNEIFEGMYEETKRNSPA